MPRLAVKLQLLSQERALEALRGYRAKAGGEDFGAFLVSEDFLSEDGLAELLRAQADFESKNPSAATSASAERDRTTAERVQTPDSGTAPDTAASAPDTGAAPASADPPRAPNAVATPASADAAQAPDTGAEPASADPARALDTATAPAPSTRLDCPPGVALEDLLRQACALGVSDLHLHSGAPMKVRIHGLLRDATEIVDAAEAKRMLYGLLADEQRALFEKDLQLDFAFQLSGVGRFRANAYHQQRGVDAVFRAIPPEAPSLEDLGLPESLAELAELHQGIVLFTGPAGCGKSSTMAAIVRVANERRRDHILTIEDPIEFQHVSGGCVINQRQVGPHTESFPRALRAALREDPDVIVIGELRDLETISLALTAAETGHLVLATLHTSGAVRTLNRILGVFPPDQQAQIRTMFSESLKAVISQRLVLKADGSGRVPAIEILPNTKAIANLIRDNKTYQIISLMQTGSSQGMRLLDNSLAELVKARVITKEEARLHAEDPRFD